MSNNLSKENRERSERLSDLLRSNMTTQATIARHCEVSTAAVAQWIKCGKISYENAVKIAEFFDVNVRWLYYGEGKMRDPMDVTNKFLNENYVAIGIFELEDNYWSKSTEQPPVIFSRDKLEELRLHHEDCMLITAQDDRMEPFIQKKDLVLFSSARNKVVDGAPYVLSIDGRQQIGRVSHTKAGLCVSWDNTVRYPEPYIYEGNELSHIKILGLVCSIIRTI